MSKDSDDKKAGFHLWRRFTKDIEPIKDPKWEELEAMFDKAQDADEQELVKMPSENVLPPIKEPETIRQYTDSDFQVDRRTHERLRKGKIQIEATLDLHGKNQGQAKIALESFILRAVSQKKRCVLVITGKGKTGHTSDQWMSQGEGILKARVPEWLALSPLRQHILQTAPATQGHGGGGALYVYLRKS